MACVPNLIIGGVEIPLQAFPAAQSYSVLGGEFVRRKLSGSAVKQSHWRKLGTRISGDGWIPPALAAVSFTGTVEISCIAPRAVNSATNSVSLPTARRTDTGVTAFAIVAGSAVSTPCNVVGDTATATTVTGATAYQFLYYPRITCYSAGPSEALDAQRGVYQWTIEAEEA